MYSFSSIKCSVLLGVVSAFSAIDSYSLRSLERERGGGEGEGGQREGREERDSSSVGLFLYSLLSFWFSCVILCSNWLHKSVALFAKVWQIWSKCNSNNPQLTIYKQQQKQQQQQQ